MAQTRAQVRSAFATRLAALAGWSESRFAADVFGRDADSLLHQAFAVGLGDSSDRRESGYRGRPATGLLVDTAIVVRWAYRLQPKAQHTSRDAAETAGQTLIASCMAYGTNWPGELKIQLLSVSSEVTASGEWFLGSQSYNVVHTLPLQ